MPAAPRTPALSSEAAPGPATKLPPGGRENGTHWAGRTEALPPNAHAPASPSPVPTTGQGPCLASVGAKGRKEGTQLLLRVSGPEARLVQPPPAAHEVAGLQAVTQQALHTGPDTTETHFTAPPGFTESPRRSGVGGQGPRKYDTAGTRRHSHHTQHTKHNTHTHTHTTPNTTQHAHTIHKSCVYIFLYYCSYNTIVGSKSKSICNPLIIKSNNLIRIKLRVLRKTSLRGWKGKSQSKRCYLQPWG